MALPTCRRRYGVEAAAACSVVLQKTNDGQGADCATPAVNTPRIRCGLSMLVAFWYRRRFASYLLWGGMLRLQGAEIQSSILAAHHELSLVKAAVRPQTSKKPKKNDESSNLSASLKIYRYHCPAYVPVAQSMPNAIHIDIYKYRHMCIMVV